MLIDEDAIASYQYNSPIVLNTGLRARLTPAIDIDVLDADVVRRVRDLIVSFFPYNTLLQRIGKPPKILIPFRALEPFKKLHRDFIYNDELHKIEVLGEGQQFVAHGIHPDTKQFYTWNVPIWEIARDELPLLNEQTAANILDAAANLIQKLGWEVRAVEPPKPKAPTKAWNVVNDYVVRRQIEGILTKVANAKKGERNGLLFWASKRLEEIVLTSGLITKHEAHDFLAQVAKHIGVDDKEISHTTRGLQS